jgi:RimJ/RimL family protein N-acetyltransferase
VAQLVPSTSSDRRAIGFVQATVREHRSELARVGGTPWQGHGYAKEAVGRVIGWLGHELGMNVFTASIRPGHGASEAVASSAGLRPSDQQVDGETVWTLTLD